MNPTIISKSEIGTVLEALEKIKIRLISEDDVDSIDNIIKLIEGNLHNLEEPKFGAYNYEDFFFEFSQQIEGLRFIFIFKCKEVTRRKIKLETSSLQYTAN